MAVKKLPSGYVVRNIKEYKSMSYGRVRPGMFLHVYYNRKHPTIPNRKILIQRVVFVLKRRWKEKMHLLDVSEFSLPEWRLFYQLYLQENNPVKFAQKLWEGRPTVVDEIKRPVYFYYNKIKIPLTRITKVTYRTYIISNIRAMKQIYYKVGIELPLTEQEINAIIQGNDNPLIDMPPAKSTNYNE